MKNIKFGVSVLALAAALGAGQARAEDQAGPVSGAGAPGEIIVTGTRVTGLKAVDSPAPIQLVGNQALTQTGMPNLNQALADLVPSFNVEALGGDLGNLTLSARLRGLSPNHTLVLVNGKRRHPTANLHVLGGQFQGGAAPDLDMIPTAAIDHIEVLQDGAAAQYGSDAIAGVVNIILKSNSAGGQLSATAGQYYHGDGDTAAASAELGFGYLDNGYLSLTAFRRFHGFSDTGGPDARISDINGNLLPGVAPSWANLPGYPHVNHINGDAESNLTAVTYNTGYDLGPAQLYSFGSWGRRNAQAYENYRVPSKLIASPVLGVAGSYTAPGELIFAPLGFNPREAIVEDDYSITGGIKGESDGWHWDLSTTYGKDKDDVSTLNSANRALYIDTHFTPTNFHDGAFIGTEWTNNLDISKDFDLGMAGPLTVAFGGEQRKDTYEIMSGDPGSIYKEGGQSYPGFQPSDASKHSRTNWAGYIDLALQPITGLKLDAAGRFEHFSDFGDTEVGKLTARYDFSPAFAIRGTVSSGFRAPTLAEEFYSATNVSPTSAVVQLPPNSAAAALLGFAPLQPEHSINYSLGFVAHPAPRLAITVDGYEIRISNRIVGTGTIYGIGGATNSPAVLAAIAAHGNVLDPTVTFVGVSLFTNGLSTRTRGVDLTASYRTDFGDFGFIDWTLAANYNETKITNMRATPAPISPQPLFDQTSISNLTTASPKEKVSLSALYTTGKWSVNLRETIYGPTSAMYSPDGGTYYKNTVPTSAITDLEVDYRLTHNLTLAAGANNLFNKKPPSVLYLPGVGITDGGNVYDSPLGISPYGINGGYYYGRVTVTF